jgi:hypothetical protein
MRANFTRCGSLFVTLFFLAGCEKYYLSLRQVPIDAEYLASSKIGSPDPRQADPPYGQKVVMQWAVPPSLLREEPHIVFHVLYRDHTQEEIIYPIQERMGMKVYSLLNEEYRSRKGLLTYRAEICTKDGQVYRQWTHQLWVHLITFEEERSADAERTSDSVSLHPKQESVTETPYCNDEGLSVRNCDPSSK